MYNALHSTNVSAPIWAVAENYRFEPGLIEVIEFSMYQIQYMKEVSSWMLCSQAARIVKEEIGKMMMVEMIAEAPMNSANPYFSTAWRQAFSVCIIKPIIYLFAPV